MAKKEAKKTPVKKSRRRLKRSVRRSLAAVLMITAIGVAAIPVPENYAEEQGTEEGTPTPTPSDVHIAEMAGNAKTDDGKEIPKYGFEPKEGLEADGGHDVSLSSSFKTDVYAGEEYLFEDPDDNYNIKLNTTKLGEEYLKQQGKEEKDRGDYPLDLSLAVLNLGTDEEPAYHLIWQYMFYWEQKGLDTGGIICGYNRSFFSRDIVLNLTPTTEYFVVTADEINNYFSKEYWEGDSSKKAELVHLSMDTSPNATEAVEYTYKDYFDYGTTGEAYEFLDSYFHDDGFATWVASCEAYKRNHPEYIEDDDGMPVDFARAPSDMQPSSPERVKYFTAHCTVLKSVNCELVAAQDDRPQGGTVYLARGDAPTGITGAFKGDLGFLALKKTDHTIMAIGDKAFSYVTNVVNMAIPDQLACIGNDAFMGAGMLESITLNNVLVIGNRAFKGCNNLKMVDLGTSTGTIGQESFSGCTTLGTIAFNSNTKKIGYGAFAKCTSLTSVSFADNISGCTVEDYAFYDCSSLTGVSMEKADITKLGAGAFAVENGSEPISFVLPQGMSGSDSIGNYLFANRAGLRSVTFPQSYGTTAEVTIPNCVFHGCVNLKYVEFPCDERNPYACGYVRYNPKQLFADVVNSGTEPNFYVKGPKMNRGFENAYPRTSTWEAIVRNSNTVMYVYMENGVEYYEVSDGYYLLCINNEGILTSCTFKSNDEKEWEKWTEPENWVPNKDTNIIENVGGAGGKLVIPAVVGETKVKGIAGDCFKDSNLNQRVIELEIEDNSEIASIAAGTFRGGSGNGLDRFDWHNLQKVYIGNSITSIGDNAFRDCDSLIDVTFSSPLGGHEAFAIGTDAFTTGSSQLTFHGDIVKGYAPFKWATDPENVINTKDGIRVCYKSLAPTYLTVMYNPVTDMVTLLDYPKYDDISSILNEAHKEEIIRGDNNGPYATYEDMRVRQLYAQYSVGDYDGRRADFANKWQEYLANDEDPTQIYSDPVYYGPWVNPDFCKGDGENGWKKYLSGGSVSGNSVDSSFGKKVTDFFFDPIIAYAAESDPDPYYETYEFNVVLNGSLNDPYRPVSEEERALVLNAREITIPAGVQSIDVYGYKENLKVDGTPTNGGENTNNYITYLKHDSKNKNSWDSKSEDMYLSDSFPPDEDDIRSVHGLFSGYYQDYKEGSAASRDETRKRGNDLVEKVTMYTVKYLPDYAFDSCEKLDTVILGSELSDIGKAPFRGCRTLQTVGGNDYYTYNNGIVYSNNSDGSLTIEECLAARGNLVGASLISGDDISNVSAIKPGAFEDCDFITEVDFGSNNTAGLTEIPEDCFKNCDKLARVTLPMTVNDVGANAFVGANSLNTLVVYGKEVKISGRAFRNNIDKDGNGERTQTKVRAYADSAAARYVKEYGNEYNLVLDEANPLGEIWQVSFYDQNYVLIEDLKDQEGNDLENPQYVEDGGLAILPQSPPNTEDWTFEKWVGTNNVELGKAIHEDSSFYARGYSTSGLVNGKYLVTFWDGVDGTQVGPTQPVEPGSDAIPPAHPAHTGYEPDGFSDDYTNIQSPMTIIMKYKPIGSSGSGTSGTGSNNSTNTSNQNGSGSTNSSSAGTYSVTVVNGSGSGTYAVGSTVIIAANSPATGMTFQKWTTESNGVTFASVSMSATTFVMPANNVTVTANYVAGTAATASTGSGNTRNPGAGSTGNSGTRVDITKPGISNKDLATAKVNGSTDNFVVKISETDAATRAVSDALTNKYGSLENILYYAMDISLYDSTGTTKISDTTGLTVDITIPIPDALVAYGGNNMAGAVINSNQLEDLNESFTTINGVPCIRFTATHFSPYTIYVDKGNLTEGMLDITPKTGDPIHPKWFLSIGLACLSIILFMKKDKKVRVKTA